MLGRDGNLLITADPSNPLNGAYLIMADETSIWCRHPRSETSEYFPKTERGLRKLFRWMDQSHFNNEADLTA